MVDLLAGHTAMIVLQAVDGMPLERDHLYVIPPGTYLSVGDGALRLSRPQARHGACLPFDFLLHSLAEAYGPRAIGMILSGTGADGRHGLKAMKAKSGLVIAQDPDEAGYDGMPRSAIAAGAVDLVLPVDRIPDALAKHGRGSGSAHRPDGSAPSDTAHTRLPQIIDLPRTRTAHDFTLYKPGTLQRRIERRMAMASIGAADMDRYLEILHRDPRELDLLARDLLIIARLTLKGWHETLDTNLTSAFLGAKYQVPAMVERGGGSLILTSSFVGHTVGMPGMTAYAASKSDRNPFGVMDVPGPEDQEVLAFAAGATLEGAADDDNGDAWWAASEGSRRDAIEGQWFSRWNGGVNGTIPGDAKTLWKQGRAEVRIEGEHVYLLFDWDHGARRGLVDVRREGVNRLVGKYINLSDPAITRPWIGLIVSHQRLDGRWPGGRLDFRRLGEERSVDRDAGAMHGSILMKSAG
ncbi:SDR family NAD(P)-dependent oxidoreductase [Inquilinus sp.]|uniref:SDR family NAD(P)-dependent oxidoreductase n=1 Tax=Inquilinus sp. TaxID=1932117 RepID=UPI0037842481